MTAAPGHLLMVCYRIFRWCDSSFGGFELKGWERVGATVKTDCPRSLVATCYVGGVSPCCSRRRVDALFPRQLLARKYDDVGSDSFCVVSSHDLQGGRSPVALPLRILRSSRRASQTTAASTGPPVHSHTRCACRACRCSGCVRSYRWHLHDAQFLIVFLLAYPVVGLSPCLKIAGAFAQARKFLVLTVASAFCVLFTDQPHTAFHGFFPHSGALNAYGAGLMPRRAQNLCDPRSIYHFVTVHHASPGGTVSSSTSAALMCACAGWCRSSSGVFTVYPSPYAHTRYARIERTLAFPLHNAVNADKGACVGVLHEIPTATTSILTHQRKPHSPDTKSAVAGNESAPAKLE